MHPTEIQGTSPRLAFEDIFKGVQSLDSQALRKISGEVARLLATRNPQTSAHREAELLRKIKTAIPADILRRQKELQVRLRAETLSGPEQAELVLLNNLIEEKNAERILCLGELARLRGVPVRELALELKTKTRHAQT